MALHFGNGEDGLAQYSLLLGQATKAVSFTAFAADSNASLTLNGQPLTSGVASAPIPVSQGVAGVGIGVTAEDGVTTRQYLIDVIRQTSAPVALVVRVERIVEGALQCVGETRQYQITVTSFGQQAAPGIEVNVPVPNGLSGVLWSRAVAAGCTPSAGQDAVVTLFDLGIGHSAVVELSGEVDPDVSFVDIVASATAASGTVSSQTRVSDPANGIGIHKNEFE